jgi:ribosome-binding protein aMBF1 (putative translation factor)
MTASSKILSAARHVRMEHGHHSTAASKRSLGRLASGLRSAREARGWSRRYMAEQMGVSLSSLAHVELAQNWPTMPVYLAMCKVLELGQPPLVK